MILGCLMTREGTVRRLLTTVRCSRKRMVIHEPRPLGQGTPRIHVWLASTSDRHLRWPNTWKGNMKCIRCRCWCYHIPRPYASIHTRMGNPMRMKRIIGRCAIPMLITTGRAWLTGSALPLVFHPLETRIAMLTVLFQIIGVMVWARPRFVISGIIRTNAMSVVSKSRI